jgi:hypothetical protein
MQGVWARRLKETFAILTGGDGIIEMIFPKEPHYCGSSAPQGSAMSPASSPRTRT